jgi:hypothetical protein
LERPTGEMVWIGTEAEARQREAMGAQKQSLALKPIGREEEDDPETNRKGENQIWEEPEPEQEQERSKNPNLIRALALPADLCVLQKPFAKTLLRYLFFSTSCFVFLIFFVFVRALSAIFYFLLFFVACDSSRRVEYMPHAPHTCTHMHAYIHRPENTHAHMHAHVPSTYIEQKTRMHACIHMAHRHT